MPANNFHLNPIGNVWNYIKIKTRANKEPVDITNQLWYNILKDYVNSMIHSLPNIIKIFIKAKGERNITCYFRFVMCAGTAFNG